MLALPVHSSAQVVKSKNTKSSVSISSRVSRSSALKSESSQSNTQHPVKESYSNYDKPTRNVGGMHKFEVGPLVFEVDGGSNVAVVGYDFDRDPHRGVVEIPSMVSFGYKDYTVTSIRGSLSTYGTTAFGNNNNLISVIIPPTVTTIEARAFSNCRNLAEVIIESQEIAIEEYAFNSCANLRLLRIYSDYVDLGRNSFVGCLRLDEIYLKRSARSFFVSLPSSPQIVVIDEPHRMDAVGEGYVVENRETSSSLNDQQDVTPSASPTTPQIVSDVDQNIPTTTLKNENTFAVIIANENYTNVSNVDYAVQDGRIFAEYCRQTLGIPQKNIKLIEDATLGAIVSNVDWLHNVLQAYGGSAKAIFYYSGHGIPNHETGESYLLPTDCPPNNYNVAYKLQDLYSRLGEAKGNVTFFIDACFSGMKRQGEVMVAARGVAIKAKPTAPVGSSVVFSAASGDQTAFAYDDKGHGIFTYFLLKKLQESKGSVSYGELAEYIKSEVAKVSIVERAVSQTPTITYTSSLQDRWSGLSLVK